MYLGLAVSAAMVISAVEELPLLTCLFESTSAIATVGLTLGITPSLSIVSKCILIALMFFGRLAGAALGAKVSAKAMLTSVSLLGLALVLGAIFLDPANTVNLPVFMKTEGFGMAEVPINAALLVLCGLCTSVMWGGIFNLAVEGLGKYTEKASGIFMAMVCGGGILPLLQNAVVDATDNYLVSYWVIAAGLAFLLFYALVGSKNVNKDIPTE
jgi:FHS family L-fucose permease-like MFS transporter